MHPKPDQAALSAAANGAVYQRSEYHCPGPKGEPPRLRAKPASLCPRVWADAEATGALRRSIMDGRVSEVWEDGFPRFVWHLDGTVVYEARHTRGPHGTFHAYPIESFQAPTGLLP